MPSHLCRILSIDGDVFTAELTPLDGGAVLHADFAVSSLPTDEPLQPGDIFDVPEMELRDLGRWTAEEIAEIYESADRQLAALLPLMD